MIADRTLPWDSNRASFILLHKPRKLSPKFWLVENPNGFCSAWKMDVKFVLIQTLAWIPGKNMVSRVLNCKFCMYLFERSSGFENETYPMTLYVFLFRYVQVFGNKCMRYVEGGIGHAHWGWIWMARVAQLLYPAIGILFYVMCLQTNTLLYYKYGNAVCCYFWLSYIGLLVYMRTSRN